MSQDPESKKTKVPVKQRVEKAKFFLDWELWEKDLEGASKYETFRYGVLRTLVTAVSEFRQDRCSTKAQALTFYSLISVVPVLAVLFGFAKGFGLDALIERQLSEALGGQQDLVGTLLEFTSKTLANTRGGLVAGVGLTLVLWSVIKLLGNIEEIFNEIWMVAKGRDWARKLSDYVALIVFAPLTLVVVGGLNVFLRTSIDEAQAGGGAMLMARPVLLVLAKLIPFLLIWAIFTLLFTVLPNRKVALRPAMVSGGLTGFVYVLIQWIYIEFQVGVSSQNAVYGSFAALPLFMAWLQLSWLLILFGAEMAATMQLPEKSRYAQTIHKASRLQRDAVLLSVLEEVVESFQRREPGPTEAQIVARTGLHPAYVHLSVRRLLRAGLVAELNDDDQQQVGYVPLGDSGSFSVCSVIDSIERAGLMPPKLSDHRRVSAYIRLLEEFHAERSDSPAKVLLVDMAKVNNQIETRDGFKLKDDEQEQSLPSSER